MGLDYWLVHFTWTIPPALVVTVAYWPFFTRIELLKILTLIAIAVTCTIPWDSYLVRNQIWTYPADAVVGLTIFKIPIEEVFFFVIQTYSTSLLYVILTKHLVLPTFLLRRSSELSQKLGSLILICGLAFASLCVQLGGRYTYLGLILIWAIPVIMFQWFLCGAFFVELPRKPIIFSILVPTVYLWIVDSLSLQRGTWVIGQGTKLDFQIWGSLDIEEATFFFMSNVMIVFGLVTVDHAVAIAEYQNAVSVASERHLPSFQKLAISYFVDQPKTLDYAFLEGLSAAVQKLAQKSQSMYLGSAMFQDRLRIDLILLYSFCRVIDDLVDEDSNCASAQLTIRQASQALRMHFATQGLEKQQAGGTKLTEQELFDKPPPSSLSTSVKLLPASRLTLNPLLELLTGFESDLLFSPAKGDFPISTEEDLEIYAHRVASTVATCLLELVFSHYKDYQESQENQTGEYVDTRKRVIQAGQKMGQALQYVNIARDIKYDAAIGRVYIPSTWLKEHGLEPQDVLEKPSSPVMSTLEERMLKKAEEAYKSSIDAINELPHEARGPVRTVVESYMSIGEMLRRKRGRAIKEKGKPKISLWRRLALAWWEMSTLR